MRRLGADGAANRSRFNGVTSLRGERLARAAGRQGGREVQHHGRVVQRRYPRHTGPERFIAGPRQGRCVAACRRGERQRNHGDMGPHRRLNQCGLEGQQLGTSGGRAFREEHHRVTGSQLCVQRGNRLQQVALARAIHPDDAQFGPQPTDEGPLPHLPLRDEGAGHMSHHRQNVEPRDVVGENQRGELWPCAVYRDAYRQQAQQQAAAASHRSVQWPGRRDGGGHPKSD